MDISIGYLPAGVVTALTLAVTEVLLVLCVLVLVGVDEAVAALEIGIVGNVVMVTFVADVVVADVVIAAG